MGHASGKLTSAQALPSLRLCIEASRKAGVTEWPTQHRSFRLSQERRISKFCSKGCVLELAT